jgi:hypothetical protein
MRAMLRIIVILLVMPRAVLANVVPNSPPASPPAQSARGSQAADAPQPAGAPQPADAPQPSAPVAAAPAVEAWDADVSDVDKLRTPDSPAFVILGASPTEIQHPTTPTDVAIALGGLVSGGDLSVAKDVAIEVAPYWLWPHPTLTLEKYRDETLLRPLRTLSLSIATTQSQRTDNSNPAAPVTHTDADIGFGLRTMLFQWGAEDACTQSAKDNAAIVSQGMLLTASEQQTLSSAGTVDSEPWQKKRDEIEQQKKATVEAATSNLKKLKNNTCLALAASTTGFSIDLAGAVDVHAVDAKLTQSATSLASYGLWANVSYDSTRFSAIAVARIRSQQEQDATTMTTGKLFDGGLRGIYKRQTYGFSAEGLIRRDLSNGTHATTYKLDLAVEYKMTDATWLSVTLGKGFALPSGDAGSWFSLANLQWSFGKPSF